MRAQSQCKRLTPSTLDLRPPAQTLLPLRLFPLRRLTPSPLDLRPPAHTHARASTPACGIDRPIDRPARSGRCARSFVRASTRRRMAGAAGHPAAIRSGHYDRCVCRGRRTTRRRRCRFARERRRAQWRVVTTSAQDASHICPRRYRPSAPGRALRAQRDRAGAHAVRAQLELRERVIAAQRCCERLGASHLDLVAVEEERRKPAHAPLTMHATSPCCMRHSMSHIRRRLAFAHRARAQSHCRPVRVEAAPSPAIDA